LRKEGRKAKEQAQGRFVISIPNTDTYRKSQLLDDSCVLSRSEARVSLAFCTGTNHFTATEYQCGGSWFSYSHDDGCKSFWIVLGVSSMQSDLLQIEFAIQIDSGHDIPETE